MVGLFWCGFPRFDFAAFVWLCFFLGREGVFFCFSQKNSTVLPTDINEKTLNGAECGLSSFLV